MIVQRVSAVEWRRTGVQEYVSLAFSPDGKTLAAQAGAPEWNLLLWIWEKAKVASMVKSTNQQGMPLYQVRAQHFANLNDSFSKAIDTPSGF